MVIGADGSLQDSAVSRALVRNHAKLAYSSVAAWLDGTGPVPEQVAAAKGVEDNLRLQDRVAGTMKGFRHSHGALSLQTIEAKPIFDGDAIRDLQVEERNRAKDLIEDFMIAANGVTARFLDLEALPVNPPRRADSTAMGQDCRAGRRARVEAAGRAGSEGAGRLPDTGEIRGPASIPGSFPLGDQADGSR